MQSSASLLPDYENPPVTEVVFGIQFKPLKGLKTPHIGLFWEKLEREEYPELKEVAPIAHTTEHFDQTEKQDMQVSATISSTPPLPRVFFINKIQNHLIQIQEDRFHQNWRKLEDNDKYPRFVELYPKFTKSWQTFQSFIQELTLGVMEPDQYELTYVNHIPRGQGWDSLSDIEKVFSEIQCRTGKRFLPEAEDLAWRKTYKLPEQTGRLHVSFRLVINKESKEQMMVLNLTARGFGDAMDNWFDKAHEWIVRGFADLTSETIQKSCWKKK